MKELMEQLSMQGERPENEGSDVEAKMEVLRQLHQMATDLLEDDMNTPTDEPVDDPMAELMGDPEAVDGMEKVEVMAPDEEGLEEGLDVAQKLMKKKDRLTKDLM